MRLVQPEGGETGALDTENLRPEALDQHRIEQLVAENLQTKLQVVEETELANALHDFVDKVGKALKVLSCICALFSSQLVCHASGMSDFALGIGMDETMAPMASL